MPCMLLHWGTSSLLFCWLGLAALTLSSPPSQLDGQLVSSVECSTGSHAAAELQG